MNRALLVLAVAASAPLAAQAQTTPTEALLRFANNNPQRALSGAVGILCPAGGGRISTALQNACNNLVGGAFQGDGNVANALFNIAPDQIGIARDQNLLGTPNSSLSSPNFSTGGGGGFAALAAGSDPYSLSVASDPGSLGAWSAFASLRFGTSKRDLSANEDGFDADTRGILVGLDRRTGDNWNFGAALDYGQRDVDTVGTAGNLDEDDFGVSLYANWTGLTGWYADGLLRYGNTSTDQARAVTYNLSSGAFSDVYASSYDSTTLAVAVTLGYHANWDTISVDPYLQLQTNNTDVDGYTEQSRSGTGAWTVVVDDQTQDFFKTQVGVRFGNVISGSNGVYLPQLDISWVKLSGLDEGGANVRFANDLSPSVGQGLAQFLITPDAEDSSFARIGLGIAAQWANGRSGFLRYEQQFGQDRYSDRQVQLGFRVEF